MKGLRYLALLGEDPRAGQIFAGMGQEWRSLVDLPCLKVVACNAGRPLLLPDRKGVLLGPIYARWGSAPVASGEQLPGLIAARGAAGLTERHWGGWIAFLRDESGNPSVVRAPFGELPCWFLPIGAAVLVSSDLALLARAGFDPKVDWPGLGRHLLFDGVRGTATCVDKVFELEGGSQLALEGGDWTPQPLWNPWSILAAGTPFEDCATASARLRDIVIECVSARARESRRILLRLSGGLDSSIVAAALHRSGVPFSCLNLVSADRTGDEREYARAVAAKLDVELEEVVRNVTAVALDCSPSAHLPRPSIRSFSLESDRIARSVASTLGADCLFDGGGGDNVFCSLQSVAPVVDRLRTTGFGRAARATARDICILSQSKLVTVWRRTIARHARRSPDRLWRADPSLLSPAFVAAQPGLADHAWLRAPDGVLPGQAAHVALLLAATDALGDCDPARPPSVSPLLSQPIVEICLRIPSWMWMEGGQNRIVARCGFSGLLPGQVAFRRGKGSPEGFVEMLFAANRPRIIEQLLDGRLAAHGILDRPAIEVLASMPTARLGARVPRLMRLHDAEVWAATKDGGAGRPH